MINYINYDQAKTFVTMWRQILKFGDIDDNYVMIDLIKNRSKNENKLDNFHKNFAVFSLNPIKEWVMIINIIMILRYKFTEIKYISNDLVQLYSIAVNQILNATDDIRIVNTMLTDELLNK